MRVLVTTFGGDGGKSGVGQYIIQFLRHCRALAPDMDFEVLLYEDEKAVYTDHDPELKAICHDERWRGASRNILWHQFGFSKFCREGGYDAVFIPAGNRRLPWSSPCPTVATCHDIGVLHVPDKYDAIHTFYNWHVLPLLLRRQTHILTVSETSKKDIVSHAKVPEERVTVTLNGVDHDVYKPGDPEAARAVIAEHYGVQGPYILYIARIDYPSKNHIRLIEAFNELKAASDLPHQLVLAGSDWLRADEVHHAAERSEFASDIVFTGFAAAEHLPLLYQGASLFAFPSIFEGFGIPIVEAMGCGTPVACGDISCLPEVAGDAAEYFDPMDVSSISAAMQRILENDEVRERCVSRGLERARLYTWEESARQAVEAIRAAAASG